MGRMIARLPVQLPSGFVRARIYIFIQNSLWQPDDRELAGARAHRLGLYLTKHGSGPLGCYQLGDKGHPASCLG